MTCITNRGSFWRRLLATGLVGCWFWLAPKATAALGDPLGVIGQLGQGVMTFGGGFLWVSDFGNPTAYQPFTTNWDHSFFPADPAQGIASDGAQLFLSDINGINRYTFAGALLQFVPFADSYDVLAFDGTDLRAHNVTDGTIDTIRVSDFAILGTIPAPLGLNDLAWSGGSLWGTFPGTNTVQAIDPGTGALGASFVPAGATSLFGIATDGSGNFHVGINALSTVAVFAGATVTPLELGGANGVGAMGVIGLAIALMRRRMKTIHASLPSSPLEA